MYTSESELKANLPPDFIRQALDDDSDGEADADLLDQIIQNASDEVDAALGQRYPVPFPSPFPAVVKTACRIFVLDTLYMRRGFSGENNPWESRAKDQREKLTRIGTGKEPLTPDVERKLPPVSVISEDAGTHSVHGRLSF